ncbi:MAG: CARDB domain-containing protein [Methanobacteriaceae archaeon]|nr:CARDB domain-containing protein [Methanobacteriaceae archaeon]
MIKDYLSRLMIISIFLLSIVSGATIVSANMNHNESITNNDSYNSSLSNNISNPDSLNSLIDSGSSNETNYSNSSGNFTLNKRQKKLVSKLKDEMEDIDSLSGASNSAVIAEISGQNLKNLKFTVENSTINSKTKKMLLNQINGAINNNNKAVQYAIKGNNKSAKKQLSLEYKYLEKINSAIGNNTGINIDNSTANNLTNITSTIIAAHDNGADWVLTQNPEMEFNQTSRLYNKIIDKQNQIKSVIKELKDSGVPIEVKWVDASQVKTTKDGQIIVDNSNSSKTNNGTVKARAAIPILVILGIVVVSAALFAIATTAGDIKYKEDIQGYYICDHCKFWMYAKNIFSSVTGSLALFGIAYHSTTALSLFGFGFGIISEFDIVSYLPQGIMDSILSYEIDLRSDGCNDDECIFYKYNKVDLTIDIDGPDRAYLHKVTPINVTIFNTKFGNASNFTVTLYQNTSSPIGGVPADFTEVASIKVSLNGKTNFTYSFDWTPLVLGSILLKAVVDSDYDVNETVENNNEITSLIEVWALPDLISKLIVPENVYVHKTTSVNAEITNNDSMLAGIFQVTLYENSTPPDENGSMNFTPIETQTVEGLWPNSTKSVSFNWTPNTTGEHVLKVVADSGNNITEVNDTNNDDLITVNVKKEKMHLYNTEHFKSSSDPSADRAIAYYYEADEPVYLNPSTRTPTFVITTTNPVFSNTGFQAWYPYGAIWLSFSNSPDGPWTSAFSNPYVYCGENTTEYEVQHWASGTGYYKYFRLYIRTQPTDWSSGVIKTFITGFDTK